MQQPAAKVETKEPPEPREPREPSETKSPFRRRLPQYMAASAACMGGLSLGSCIGWSAPSVELLKEVHGYDSLATNLIASSFLLGPPLGLTMVPFLVDRIGRKWTMLSITPAFLLGWIFITAGISELPLLILGRILTGACGGMFCVIAPMYCVEISETQIRGTLGTFFQLLLVIGILHAYIAGHFRSVTVTSILCGIMPIAAAIEMFFVPESPLYYLVKGNEEAARKSLRFFRGAGYNIEPDIRALKDQVEKSKQNVSLKVFLQKPVMRTMALAFGLMFAQQFSGINAIIFFAETIFKQTGVDMDTHAQMIIFAVVQVVACVISALLIDKLGRKLLMMISCGVMCICLCSLGLFFFLKGDHAALADNLSWLPLTSACLYILAFCLGAGPIPWAYMGEIFPAKLKGTASSSAGFVNWMLAFIVTVSFSTVVDAVGSAIAFLFYAIICGLSVIFVKVFMIETKGKTIAEILQEFGTYNLD